MLESKGEGANEVLDRYLASWAGVDGGNPKAPIWICGIEHGGELCELVELKAESGDPPYWTEEFKAKHNICSWQYHQKAAKVLMSVEALRKDPHKLPLLDGWREYVQSSLYVKDGNNFKLNLFPLQARSVSEWPAAYKEKGIRHKEDYYARCRVGRFNFFTCKRKKYNPKVIIGTGITFHKDFVHAFGFEGVKPQESTIISDGRRSRPCFIYKTDDSMLIVTPFFGGRNGLNSDSLLQALARIVVDRLQRNTQNK